MLVFNVALAAALMAVDVLLWASQVAPEAWDAYFPFVAVSVTGTLRIEGIDDGAGYAAGCFRIEGTATEEL